MRIISLPVGSTLEIKAGAAYQFREAADDVRIVVERRQNMRKTVLHDAVSRKNDFLRDTVF